VSRHEAGVEAEVASLAGLDREALNLDWPD
jgi:hypothetical protein